MKKALLFLGAFLMIAVAASAQRSETGVKPQKTTKSTTTTEKKGGTRFNLSLGYGTQNIKMDGKKYSLSGKEGESTSGFFAGVSWDLDIAKGIGLEFADVAIAYYSGSNTSKYSEVDWDDGGEYNYDIKSSVSFFNLFVSPVKFQYRYAINDKFAVFAATGPSLEYCLSYSSKTTTTVSYSYYYYDDEETITDTDSELPWKSLYFYWDLQGGIQFNILKLTMGTGFGLNNVIKDDSPYTANINRPFFVKLSFVF